MEIDFIRLLSKLAKRRPIFHSEKDFQYEVGWEMRNFGAEKIRMERPVKNILRKKRARVDIFSEGIAVELKYPTAKLEVTHDKESFYQSGPPIVIQGVYRFWEDVWRIEQLIHQGEVKIGYAILLSNRPEYWDVPDDKLNGWLGDYCMPEGKVLSGELVIRNELRIEGKSRKLLQSAQNIVLRNKYEIHWRDWYNFEGEKHGKYRYLLLEAKS